MKLKLGIVGLGRAGRGMHLPELETAKDVIEIAAVCDIIKERADTVAARCGCKAYYDIKEIIADPDIDMIDIATRSCDHASHAIMALEAGKDVILEKPMSTCIEEARAVFECAEKNGRKVYIRHNRRWEGQFNQALALIDSGIIGKVFEMKLARNAFETRNDWQTLEKYGGGLLLNWGPHIIDHALQYGQGYKDLYYNLKQINASGDCEDHIKIVLTGNNGMIVDLEISSGCALDFPLYTAYGTRGSFVIYNDRIEIKYIDEAYEIIKKDPVEDTPGDKYGNADVIPWKTKTIPAENIALNQVWRAVYEDWAGIKPYRIKKEEALAVMEVISRVKEGRKAGLVV